MKQLKERIISNEKVAPGFYRMRVASAYLARNSKPGQFFEVRVSEKVDPLLRRPFSCHRISKGAVEILYEAVGPATGILSHRKAGQILDIIGPLGNGFEISKCKAVLVGGGIGVAPLLALAESMRNKPSVLIGARTRAHVLCEKEFKALGCGVSVATDDGSKGHEGFVTDLLKGHAGADIYACGPHAMLKTVSGIARHAGVSCQVSLEERMACGVGVCLGCPVKVSGGYKMVCKDGPVFDSCDIIW